MKLYKGMPMKLIQLKSIRDLVMLIGSSSNAGVIQHIENNNQHIYFLVGGTLHELFFYFVKENEKIPGSFVTYNSYTNQISSSERMQHEPNVNSFAIVEIANQDLVPKDFLSKLEGLLPG